MVGVLNGLFIEGFDVMEDGGCPNLGFDVMEDGGCPKWALTWTNLGTVGVLTWEL